MTEHIAMMVPHGVGAENTLNVYAPFDNHLIATVETASAQAIETALTTAYQLYKNRKEWLSPAQRMKILGKTADIMLSRADELALDAAREGGKPLTDSKVEVARAIDGIKNCIDVMRTESGKEIPMNLNPASCAHLAVTRMEPIGVVVAISAFNHPLNLAVHQIGPAVAAGCPVIIKPAEDTPLSCFKLVSILREAGLPESWCQALVVDDLNLATQLVTDPRVAFLSFIGSANVGWMLRSKLAPGTRCALEHGGPAPVIIAADADLDDTLPIIAKAGLYHAGQVCVSIQRVYIHESIFEEVSQRLTRLAEKMTVGDPTLETTDIGPLIRAREVDRIEQWVNESVQMGGELLTGGKRISDSCYEATIIRNAGDKAPVNCKEVFGPVVSLNSYSDIDEAISYANALPYAFQAAVFTRDIDTALYAQRFLEASAVMINDSTAFRVDWMPFAGLRQSGLGVGGIPHTFRDMQIEKMLVFRSRVL